MACSSATRRAGAVAVLLLALRRDGSQSLNKGGQSHHPPRKVSDAIPRKLLRARSYSFRPNALPWETELPPCFVSTAVICDYPDNLSVSIQLHEFTSLCAFLIYIVEDKTG